MNSLHDVVIIWYVAAAWLLHPELAAAVQSASYAASVHLPPGGLGGGGALEVVPARTSPVSLAAEEAHVSDKSAATTEEARHNLSSGNVNPALLLAGASHVFEISLDASAEPEVTQHARRSPRQEAQPDDYEAGRQASNGTASGELALLAVSTEGGVKVASAAAPSGVQSAVGLQAQWSSSLSFSDMARLAGTLQGRATEKDSPSLLQRTSVAEGEGGVATLILLIAMLVLIAVCMVQAANALASASAPAPRQASKLDMVRSNVPLSAMATRQEEVVLPPQGRGPSVLPNSAMPMLGAMLGAPPTGSSQHTSQQLVPGSGGGEPPLLFLGGQLVGCLAPELAVRRVVGTDGIAQDSEALTLEGVLTSRPQQEVVLVHKTSECREMRAAASSVIMKLYMQERGPGRDCGVLLETTGFAGEDLDPVAFVNTAEALPKTVASGWGYFRGTPRDEDWLSPRYATIHGGGPANPPFAVVHASGAITCPLGHPLRKLGAEGVLNMGSAGLRCHVCGQAMAPSASNFGNPQTGWVCCDSCRGLEGSKARRGSLHSWVMRGCTHTGEPGPLLLQLTRSGRILNVGTGNGNLIATVQEDMSETALLAGDTTPRDLARRRLLRVGLGADVALILAAIVAVEKLS